MGSGSASVVSAGSIDATGGTITTSGGRKYHTFTSTQFFTLNSNPNNDVIQILLVGAGGGGGSGSGTGGGGGGGGGVLLVNITSLTPGSYSMSVDPAYTNANGTGLDAAWVLFGVTSFRAKGGGKGGSGPTPSPPGATGGNGGSGGGGAGSNNGGTSILGTVTGTNPAGTTVQNLGNNGGKNTFIAGGSGGGGALSVGGASSNFESGYIGGAGGGAYLYNGVWYGGGGGGGATYQNISRGAYGGSNAGNGGYTDTTSTRISPTDGVLATGGGGGGGWGDGGTTGTGPGARGGSGVIIISYPLNTTSTATYSPGVAATSMVINGVEPSFSNYPIIDTRVAGSGSSWTVAATFNTLSGAPGISTVTFYYVYK